MKTLGEPVSDLMLAQIFMNALPASYAVVNTVIQTSHQHGSISSDSVVKAALAEEERRKKGLGLTAMFTHISKPKHSSGKSSANDSKGKKKKDKGPPCQNCAKPGHTKQECWAKGGGAEGTGPHQKRRASVSTIYALPAVDNRSSGNSWLLDSGASRHMTPNRHWFSTYQPLVTPVLIRVGDGNRIPAIGVGRIPS